MSDKSRPSFDKINYMLRPRKQIERKILIELFHKIHKLRPDIDIHRYRYIGMGSIFYYDFILFHKYLQIARMTSIDADLSSKRFRFNRPYDFIDFENVDSTTFLENHKFDDPTILWLDYDKPLFRIVGEELINNEVFDDLRLTTEKCHTHDFLILTVDVRPPSRIRDFKAMHDKYRQLISMSLDKSQEIDEDNFHLVVQDILLNYLAVHERFQERKFRKLFSFYYSDGTPMLSIGGILDVNDNLQSLLANERFVKVDRKIDKIDVPILTYKEKMYLDSSIKGLQAKLRRVKTKSDSKRVMESIKFEMESVDALRAYINDYYRYYPQYYEGIV
jgi:hypothetical protein